MGQNGTSKVNNTFKTTYGVGFIYSFNQLERLKKPKRR